MHSEKEFMEFKNMFRKFKFRTQNLKNVLWKNFHNSIMYSKNLNLEHKFWKCIPKKNLWNSKNVLWKLKSKNVFWKRGSRSIFYPHSPFIYNVFGLREDSWGGEIVVLWWLKMMSTIVWIEVGMTGRAIRGGLQSAIKKHEADSLI